MTLLEFISPHLENYFDFKIEKTQSRFQITIPLKSTELNENLVLSITKFNLSKEIHICLRDTNVFGCNSYILNRFSTLIGFDAENLKINSDFDKFCGLVKQYVSLNSRFR